MTEPSIYTCLILKLVTLQIMPVEWLSPSTMSSTMQKEETICWEDEQTIQNNIIRVAYDSKIYQPSKCIFIFIFSSESIEVYPISNGKGEIIWKSAKRCMKIYISTYQNH